MQCAEFQEDRMQRPFFVILFMKLWLCKRKLLDRLIYRHLLNEVPHLYVFPCNTGVGTHVFQTRKNFSENYPQFGHALSKIFAGSVVGRKILKDVCLLKGPKLLACPSRAPSSLWPALEGTRQIQVHSQWGSELSCMTLYLLFIYVHFLGQYYWISNC
jgi:hypothetical protein